MIVTVDTAKILTLLEGINPASDEFKCGMYLINGIYWYNSRVSTNETRGSVVEEPIADNVIIHSEPKVEEPKRVEAEEGLTVEVVRDAITSLAQLGVKVKPIMAKYIPEGLSNKFSNIPAKNYEALMAEIATARTEANANA